MSRHRCVRDIQYAYLTHDAPRFKNPTRTAAQAKGVRYEQKVFEKFLKKYDYEFLPHPWFCYQERGKWKRRFCQPDGLIIQPERGKITIIEVKLRHVADAYFQLFELYLPVVREVFGGRWKYGCTEVVRWYDPDEPTPETAFLCRTPDVVNPGVFGVHICRT